MSVSVVVKNKQVAIDIEGMVGPGCKNVMDAVTAAAQLKDIKDEPKDDFHAGTSQGESAKEGT